MFTTDFMIKTDIPIEAQKEFSRVYNLITQNEKYNFKFEELKQRYMNDADCNKSILEELNVMADKININMYTLHFVFLLFCTYDLFNLYKEHNINEELYWDLMMDLKYKVLECKTIYNIWGIFTFEWFKWHFLLKRFALGRFQFEKTTFKLTSYKNSLITVNENDTVYNFHIPSSGPLTEKSRMDSYKKAYEFFKTPDMKYIIFTCESWLLYPDNEHIFNEKSNLSAFMKDFDIIKSTQYDGFPDAWRVFGKNFAGDVSDLPCETSLQKNFINWLEKGNKVGSGYGVIVFDGENIINN